MLSLRRWWGNPFWWIALHKVVHAGRAKHAVRAIAWYVGRAKHAAYPIAAHSIAFWNFVVSDVFGAIHSGGSKGQTGKRANEQSPPQRRRSVDPRVWRSAAIFPEKKKPAAYGLEGFRDGCYFATTR